jgi:hypothetical protein
MEKIVREAERNAGPPRPVNGAPASWEQAQDGGVRHGA